MIRKRPLMPLLLLLVAVTTLTDAQKAESRASVDSSAILESAMCLIRTNPWQCIRQQAGRMLDNWEDILDAKKHEMMEEADKEAQKREAGNRALGEDSATGKQAAKPSSLMNQIEDGLSLVADFVSDGVDSYVDDSSSKRKSVAVDAADAAGTGKKHLHHILHKLGSKSAGATNSSGESGVARGSDVTDLDEEVEAAVEDGFVDYGFGAGPEKAIGRGKQGGDPDFGYGDDGYGNGGGSDLKSNTTNSKRANRDDDNDEEEEETGRNGSGEGGGFRRMSFDFF